ncbi:hypothetical protein [Bacillus weihaiensis]|nr:hypothetical protein [Bacillus weihaiensis]
MKKEPGSDVHPKKLDELILPFGVFLVVKYDERLKRNVVNAYLVGEGG